jgi:hypothetical protein
LAVLFLYERQIRLTSSAAKEAAVIFWVHGVTRTAAW